MRGENCMKNITLEVKEELRRLGADIVGIGDISILPPEVRKNMIYGIAVAISLDPDVIKGIEYGPTMEYYLEYDKLNEKLDEIVTLGAQYIQSKGYEAVAQTVSEVSKTETEYSSLLPHKTVATRAGIGWIGKNAMLVTKEFGSAVRISAILTNASLQADKSMNESRCMECMCCKEACPGEAITGINWSIASYRDMFFDSIKCRKAARRITKERLNIDKTLCGKCIFVCPFTQAYLKKCNKNVE
jgi:epoxyqueuosine reductase QueG